MTMKTTAMRMMTSMFLFFLIEILLVTVYASKIPVACKMFTQDSFYSKNVFSSIYAEITLSCDFYLELTIVPPSFFCVVMMKMTTAMKMMSNLRRMLEK